jgi:hypothetical protein
MNSKSLMAMTAGLVMGVMANEPTLKRLFEPLPERTCSNCGTVYNHNKSYCSAKCCKEAKAKSRKTGKE